MQLAHLPGTKFHKNQEKIRRRVYRREKLLANHRGTDTRRKLYQPRRLRREWALTNDNV